MTNAFGTFIDTTERTHSAYEFNLNDTLIESIINRESKNDDTASRHSRLTDGEDGLTELPTVGLTQSPPTCEMSLTPTVVSVVDDVVSLGTMMLCLYRWHYVCYDEDSVSYD